MDDPVKASLTILALKIQLASYTDEAVDIDALIAEATDTMDAIFQKKYGY